jgi:hypothetical protein
MTSNCLHECWENPGVGVGEGFWFVGIHLPVTTAILVVITNLPTRRASQTL